MATISFSSMSIASAAAPAAAPTAAAPTAAPAAVLAAVPQAAPAAITGFDGGEACSYYSYATLCANLRQYSGSGNQWPWGELYQASGSASPDMYSMSMSVELCKGSTRSLTCNRPSNAPVQSWNILSDWNNECSFIWRGGPSDSGACDMSGLSIDGLVGTYYYSKVTVTFKRYSSDVVRTMTALSPVQLDRA
jgi:hypothetical protein